MLRRYLLSKWGRSYLLAFTRDSLLIYEILADVPLGESKMRFLHLAAETPPLDLAVKNRDIVFPNVLFQGITEYLGLTPMTVDLELRISGSKQVVLPLDRLQFKANESYTLALLGSLHEGLELLMINEQSS